MSPSVVPNSPGKTRKGRQGQSDANHKETIKVVRRPLDGAAGGELDEFGGEAEYQGAQQRDLDQQKDLAPAARPQSGLKREKKERIKDKKNLELEQ